MDKSFIKSKLAAAPEFDCIRKHDFNRCTLFFTVNNRTRFEQVKHVGGTSILMSYEYLRKSLKFYENEMLPWITDNNGLFMTDSGVFSFISPRSMREEKNDPEYWIPYIEEYVQFLYDNREHIYCAANFDLDFIVGPDKVDEWNEKYFKPLLDHINIVPIVHQFYKHDHYGFNRLRQYASEGYDYIGIASSISMRQHIQKYAQEAKRLNVRLHGFGFTEYGPVVNNPLFSIDSSSWTMGSRYGESHFDSGRDFLRRNMDFHHFRKHYKKRIIDMGIDYENVSSRRANDYNVNVFNLHGWLRFYKSYLESGNIKLPNYPTTFYRKELKEVDLPDFYVPSKERTFVKMK